MPADGRSRFPRWQQSLLLVTFGIVVGYGSFQKMDTWGNGGQHQALYGMGFFIGIVAFISGIVGFLAIAGGALISPRGSGQANAVSRSASTDALHRTTSPRHLADATPLLQESASSKAAASLTGLRITLVAVIAITAVVVLRNWGQPSLASSYGRSYWLSAVVALLLGQLPYAISLVRTWKVPDRAGLALAIASGVTQVVVTFYPNLRSAAIRLDPWLSTLLGLATVVFASLAWRPFFSRKGDVGLLTSLFFGIVAYTVLAQITLAMLRFWMLR